MPLGVEPLEVGLVPGDIMLDVRHHQCSSRDETDRSSDLLVGEFQICVAIRPQGGLMNDLSHLANCTDDVSRWFLESGLLLNPTNTEAIVFGTAARLMAVDTSIGIMAAGSNIKFSEAVKLLGVNLDRCLTMDSHVASVVRSCNFHIRALRIG